LGLVRAVASSLFTDLIRVQHGEGSTSSNDDPTGLAG